MKMISISQAQEFFGLFAEQSSKIEVAIDAKQVDSCRSLIQDLQKLLNANASTLPSRDIQTYTERIEAFKRRLDDIKAPKKKFGFSKATKEAQNTKAASNAVVIDESAKSDQGDKSNVDATSSSRSFLSPKYSLRSRSGEKLELSDVEGEVELRDLEECEIRICGQPAILYLNEVNKCTIVCDPVASSILIVGFKDSTLKVACQQLRVHKALGSTFYLHITSRSIIEDCNNVTFGPLSSDYPAYSNTELWEKSGLERSKNNYKLVDDFNWLNTTQASPHWKLMEEQSK